MLITGHEKLGIASFMYLGDLIEKGTERTGIKAVVTKISKGDCGCKARKEKLNKIDKDVRSWVEKKVTR